MRRTYRTQYRVMPLELLDGRGLEDLDGFVALFDEWAQDRGMVADGADAESDWPYLSHAQMQIEIIRRLVLPRVHPGVERHMVDDPGHVQPLRFVRRDGDAHSERMWAELVRGGELRLARAEIEAAFDEAFPKRRRGEHALLCALLTLDQERRDARGHAEQTVERVIEQHAAADDELLIAAELVAGHDDATGNSGGNGDGPGYIAAAPDGRLALISGALACARQLLA